jgi:hypothetical protein
MLVLIPGLPAVGYFLMFLVTARLLLPQLPPIVGFLFAFFVLIGSAVTIVLLMRSDRRRRARRHSREEIYHH